jgi:hypothetical protein
MEGAGLAGASAYSQGPQDTLPLCLPRSHSCLLGELGWLCASRPNSCASFQEKDGCCYDQRDAPVSVCPGSHCPQ